MYIYDEFISLQVGDGFRLFPFGNVIKNGVLHEITPELARRFKLPHFKPAIKLGSHDEATPAGGHIVGLEVREDGLYAIPEWNEQGIKAMSDGAYRYQSPEVIWADNGIEDPENGGYLMGPLILGDALLHTPHLGDKAALYSVEITKETKMNQAIEVPQTLWDKLTAMLDRNTEPKIVEVIPDEYKAAVIERDEFKAQLEAKAKADAFAVRVSKFEGELKETKAEVGMAELLAGVPDETAEAIMKQFRALSAQINETQLVEEKGTEGEAMGDPKAAFNALVLKYSIENKLTYDKAFDVVKVTNYDLFTQAFKK